MSENSTNQDINNDTEYVANESMNGNDGVQGQVDISVENSLGIKENIVGFLDSSGTLCCGILCWSIFFCITMLTCWPMYLLYLRKKRYDADLFNDRDSFQEPLIENNSDDDGVLSCIAVAKDSELCDDISNLSGDGEYKV